MSVLSFVYVSLRRAFLAASLLAVPGILCAQTTVSTDPVGAVVITFLGGSDTLMSLPLHRPVSLEATVSGVSGNIVGLNLAGATLTANQFVYQGSGTNTYYAQFITGNREGMYYTVTANDVNGNLSLNLNGDTGFSGNVAIGDSVQIIPYWTLNTLFPSGAGLHTGANLNLNTQSNILVPPTATAGTNLPAGSIYFYDTAAPFGPGWRLSSDATPSHHYPDVIVSPDSSIIVRNPVSSANTTLTLVGSVPMSAQTVVLNTLAANTKQDNVVALPVPVSVTFGASGLGSVLTHATNLNPLDTVLLFDPTVALQNKPSTGTYFYYNGGAFGAAGWRKVGDTTTVRDNDVLMSPGTAFVVRLGARAQPTTLLWNYLPSYLSN